MTRYNIVTSKEYEKNGEVKKQWMNVGSLVKFEADAEKPEGFILELNMFPGTKFSVFEQKPREDGPPQNTQQPPQPAGEQGKLNVKDIPF